MGLYSAGIYKGQELERALAYLNRFKPRTGRRVRSNYFYGHYYAVQAMWQAGDPLWFEWYPAIRDELLGSQETGGPWRDTEPFIGPAYATAMACLILQMPNGLLPIFQR